MIQFDAGLSAAGYRAPSGVLPAHRQAPTSAGDPADLVSLGEAPDWRPPTAPQLRAAGMRPTPASVHITQYRDPVYNPGGDKDESNGNCGPTSLAMALRLVGLQVPGTSSGDSPQTVIDRSRLAMHPHDASGDGLDEAGQRSPDEHRRATGYGHLRRGAEAAGARTEFLRGLPDLQRALGDGQPVILVGNPGGKQGYAARLGQGAEDHIIVISGFDAERGTYTINDPAQRGGPLTITQAELQSFVREGSGTHYGMAVSRPQP